MITDTNAYNIEMLNQLALEKISQQNLNNALTQYLNQYTTCFTHPSQTKYFKTYQQGLLSNLDRKSIEPIALHFLNQHQVRHLQQFFKRPKNWQQPLTQTYQTQLANQIADPDGFLSIDDCCHIKKGTNSAGVARQYCGRIGKKENCQSGVYVSYASKKGYGIVDTQLYLPKQWFDPPHFDKRIQCEIPKDLKFQTKNDIAAQMITNILNKGQFPVKWVGCDAAFGSDQGFLDGLPSGVCYFASVRENQYIYLTLPTVEVPKNPPGQGGRFVHPRACAEPVYIKSILEDKSVVWERRIIAQGAKGPVWAEVVCVRAYSCRCVNRLFVPTVPIWVYIRRYEDGAIKYFISNASENTELAVLDRLATMRWSIEQCFQECKSFLGMSHYETRSYQGWHRHMLLVMVAHLFTTVLRGALKKTTFT